MSFFFLIFIYLFLAVLGIYCCMPVFSSCGAWVSHCSGLSCCGAQSLECKGFSSCGMWAQWLWLMDFIAPQHDESSGTRDQTCVPCIGR